MHKILIIEDDLIDQMAFTRLFDRQKMEFQHTIANSIGEAKKELAENSFDLVISDLNLADGTTFDLLTTLNKIPFIIITGNQDEATIDSLKKNSGAFACLIKDINLQYLEELPQLAKKILSKNYSAADFPKTNLGYDACKKIIRSKNLTIDLGKTFKLFDNNKEDVRETIEIFITNKPREMNDLYHFLNIQDCENVVKITHRMKSGFRVLGMENQEKLAEYIEKNTGTPEKGCLCHTVTDVFQQLSLDTKLAIDLLKKEIPLL